MIKCLVVDDESLARDLLKSYISKFDQLSLLAEAKTAIEAIQILSNQQIDLLFLDINLPHLTGIEMLSQMKNIPLTVLCTAHSDYALQSYEFDVVDYLLKPISLGRFTKTISKVTERLGLNKNHPQSSLMDIPFYVKSDYKKIKIDPAQIKYIEAMEKYVRIHLSDRRIMTLMSMSMIMKYLDSNRFIRIHRSYIVNINAISAIEGNMIVIKEDRLPVSKANRHIIQNF